MLTDRRLLAVNQRGHGASAWAEVYSPEVMAEDVAGMSSAPTVQGESLSIDASDGVKVDDAKAKVRFCARGFSQMLALRRRVR